MADVETLTKLLTLLGSLHFTQLPAMLAAGKVLNWQGDLARLSSMNRRLVQVVLVAITIVVVGLGLVVVLSASDLALGRRSAIMLSGFLSLFWGYRALVQVTIYRRCWPSSLIGRVSHHLLALLFSFLSLGYGVACLLLARAIGR